MLLVTIVFKLFSTNSKIMGFLGTVLVKLMLKKEWKSGSMIDTFCSFPIVWQVNEY